MNGEDILGFLIKLLEEQEQIKVTYEIMKEGGNYELSETS